MALIENITLNLKK